MLKNNLFHVFRNAINFSTLSKQKKSIVIYSEGKNYWIEFSSIVHLLINKHDSHVCFLTSDINDPGLQVFHKNYNSFFIGNGLIRNWIFENIDADVFAMTMPDIDIFQIKRSKIKSVKYVYIQHSLVSLHGSYRERAFDNFDILFCSGPHQIIEARALEKANTSKQKVLFEHGYAKIDSLLQQVNSSKFDKIFTKSRTNNKTVLFAPTWGANGALSTVGFDIVNNLLLEGFNLIFRPHPESLKHEMHIVKKILCSFGDNDQFHYSSTVDELWPLLEAKILITDWSGVAFEFGLALGKPILFIDVPQKINNLNYKKLNISLFENTIRNDLGYVLDCDKVEEIGSVLKNMHKNSHIKQNLNQHVFNVGRSDHEAATYLANLVKTS